MTAIGAALLLGIIQGLTEFLPISSSGHLVVGARLLSFTSPSLIFEVLLHMGTLFPVLWHYRRDIGEVAASVVRLATGRVVVWREDRGLTLAVCVAAGSLPTAMMGLALKDLFAQLFSSITCVGVAFLITGGILMLTRLRQGNAPAEESEPADSHRSLTPLRGFVVGIAQGAAITPGISRSGTTITAALLLGVDRTMAARLSFLLSVPAILGAVALEVGEVSRLETDASIPVYFVGAIAAAATGYLALRWLVKLVQRGRMHRFAPYLWAVGLAVLVATAV